jgi:hypothetical protein
MPLHPSQWNGTVVRVGDDAFNLDTYLPFGLAPSAGIYVPAPTQPVTSCEPKASDP